MLDEIKPAERTIIGGHSRFENFGCCINLSLKHYSLQVQCHTQKASLPANSLESDGRNALYSLRLTTRARPNSAISANTSELCRNRSVGNFPHHVGDTERRRVDYGRILLCHTTLARDYAGYCMNYCLSLDAEI